MDPRNAYMKELHKANKRKITAAWTSIGYRRYFLRFASICKTDSNNRLIPPNNWDATIYPVDLAASNLGDIVSPRAASTGLLQDIVLGGTSRNERAPHLAAMGKNGMLAMWEGSSAGGDLQEGGDCTIFAQVLDRATGKALSQKVTVDKSVVGNRYQALKSFPDGSVAYLSKGKTDQSVQVVRFFGC
ncbi:hypothetical protein PHYSODRAFT_247918 [Phytophthora sojae]|uniref:Uncharacterized protein n=1 Tax=Phytophthora sojae (strain P6497) TaxID=1094619 RepID=G4ZGJ1_PHYSP|nr:hypothetical protein PHYSODRAFT_247918 [Phytophthora sojae]EGZ16693.1 hypothetical protein PHYSODRAFT_247918 [Phytophthora sojae]|eukprot:XP_009525751.1 hypothetical protein PHYSODRAFT_247918 [Phytophthora sojae]